MIRDPLYRSIIKSLSGDLDGDTFERCAQDLLRDAYPTLVPMVGGDDAGFDGAIGTPEGPYPLCCTVDKAGPLGNFRKNISTYLKKRPDGPKRALIATPRIMTARKRRNLEDAAAKDYGLQIVNIHDQSDFALWLYRNDKWRKELLGLTGAPPALSALPRRSRSERPPLLGREEDLHWLQIHMGVKDALLVGQPGLGKTYLHQHMALEGAALFAVDNDPERLANAIREQRPQVIVVDDAHEDIDLLQELVRLRLDLRADYAIHANSWPHGKDRVMAVLDLPDESVHELQPLTMPMIRTLIEKLGIVGPDRLLSLLLRQAEGKPGLAAALVNAVERGEYESVWSGQAIARRLLYSKKALGDEKSRIILAVLGLGGDAGLSVEETAAFLQISPLEVRNTVTELAAGGVVEELNTNWPAPAHKLSVRPPVLRGWLARACFYGSAGSLDPSGIIETLRQDTSRCAGLASTLMDARMRGAIIPNKLLFDMVSQAAGRSSNHLWEHLAVVDEKMAAYILDHAPEMVHNAARGLLAFHPDRTLALLLNAAVSEESERKVEAPRRRIKEWIQGDEPGDSVCLNRRRALVISVEEKLKTNEDDKLEHYAWALGAAMHPGIDFHKTTPDDPMTIVMYYGLLKLPQIRSIAQLWPRISSLTLKYNNVPKEIRSIIDNWCYPGRFNRGNNPTPEDCGKFMHTTASKMLADLLPVCNRPALTWARELSRNAGLGVIVNVDRNFHRMFADRDFHDDYETRLKRRQKVFYALAEEYLSQQPKDAMAELAELESEAAEFSEINAWDRNQVYWRIADQAGDVKAWILEAINARLPATLIQTMLDVARKVRHLDSVDIIPALQKNEEYRRLMVGPILSMPNPPADMLEDVLNTLSYKNYNQALVHIIGSEKPPINTMKRLLSHPDQGIRSLSAIAEWKMEPEASVRDDLQEQWQEAILMAGKEDEYDLIKVLNADSELAMKWALAKVNGSSENSSSPYGLWKFKRIFLAIINTFDTEQRWHLLDEVDLGSFSEEIVSALMGSVTELILRWFNKHLNAGDRGRYLALKVLHERRVDDHWRMVAIAALDSGYSPKDIADTVGHHSQSTVGPVSDYYGQYMTVFEELSKHSDNRLHPAAKKGLEWTRANYEKELAEEHRNAVRGHL